MSRDTVKFLWPYGPLKRGLEYTVVGEGYDYVSVKGGGGIVHVPNSLIAPVGYRFETYARPERDEEEEYA